MVTNSFIDLDGNKYKLRLKIKGNRCIFLKDRKGCVLEIKDRFL